VAHCTQSSRSLSITNFHAQSTEFHHLAQKPSKTSSRTKKKAAKTKKNKPYKHPIPSRNDLLDMLTEVGKPLKAEPLMQAYGLKGQRMRSLLIDQ